MKKILLGSVLAAVMSLPLSASAEGGYAGIHFGQSRYSVDDAGMTATSRDERGNAFRISGGYQFDENFGVEIGYADLGKASNVYTISGTPVTVSGDSSSFYVAGTASTLISDQFSLFGKLGVARNKSSLVGSVGTTAIGVDGNKTSALVGVGLGYNFTDKVTGTLEYDHFGKLADDNSKVGMWSVGVRFNF